MRFFLARTIRFLLVALVLYSCVKWFSYNPLSVDLDPDEVVWVLDAEAYEKYRKGEWDFFTISSQTLQGKWYHPQYRIVDQPQAGKYILGFFLELAGHQPWKSVDKTKSYYNFSKMKLPSGSLESISEVLDPQLYESIIFIRYLHLGIGFLLILLSSLAIHFVTKNIEAALVFFALLINHVGFANQIRLATVDLYAFLFQLFAIVVFFMSFNTTQSKKRTIFLAVVSGFLTAVATSIKLNGAFLVFGPYLFLVMKMLNLFFKQKGINKKEIQNITIWFVGFAISGIAFFTVLEPELWLNPVQNIHVLLTARLLQQQWFLHYFEKLSFWQVATRIWSVAVRQPWFVFIISGLVMVKKYTKNFEYLPRFSIRNVTKQQQLFSILLLPIIGAIFYYGKVGFERYFSFAVISIYSVLVVLLLSNKNHDDTKN